MSDHSVQFSQGIPETVLAPPPDDVLERLAAALAVSDESTRREHVADVVAELPRVLEGWAALGDLGRDVIESYACYRVGYHRGLDALRASG
ncbi:MAG: DUF3151 family protein, partial [Actinomycetota bacterium]|nr:DUF3151 family protein [Actinomycetota bacterium]